MAVFVRILLAVSLAFLLPCVCKAGEQQQSHWSVAMGIKHQADSVESKSDDGKDSAEEISIGKKIRRSITQSDRTDSVAMMNNLRRTVGSSNMPYMAYDFGAESDAASWTAFCNFDRIFNTPGYANGFKYITIASKSISTVIRDLFNLFPREMSSVYLTSFGCDLNNCNYATYQGYSYQNAQLTLCLFKGGSQYNDSKVQYKLGEGCTECNSGSFWCDYGLCRGDCATSDSCYCNSYCMNCADTDTTTCRCQCLQGWTGSRCEIQSSQNATEPTCSTTVRSPKTLTTISLDIPPTTTSQSSMASITSVLQLVCCAFMALFITL